MTVGNWNDPSLNAIRCKGSSCTRHSGEQWPSGELNLRNFVGFIIGLQCLVVNAPSILAFAGSCFLLKELLKIQKTKNVKNLGKVTHYDDGVGSVWKVVP